MSRRTLFGIMAGGSALWWVALRGSFPLAAVDKQKNVALLKTKGGNLVAATQVWAACCSWQQAGACGQLWWHLGRANCGGAACHCLPADLLVQSAITNQLFTTSVCQARR
jgi:hypothetical protein